MDVMLQKQAQADRQAGTGRHAGTGRQAHRQGLFMDALEGYMRKLL